MSNPTWKEIGLATVVGVAIAASMPLVRDFLNPKPAIKLNLAVAANKPSPLLDAQQSMEMGAAIPQVQMPVRQRIDVPTRLSEAEQWGKELFDQNCASCHGLNAAGTESGPTFIHNIYRPDHHPDQSFYRAAQQGVRQHHWRFGDMPSMANRVNDLEVRAIIEYVRTLQVNNGIR